MTIRNALRTAVIVGWLLEALLLERVLTLGAITDVSGVDQNPPAFVAIGVLLLALALGSVITVTADYRHWRLVSLVVGIAYVAAGIWLRLENGDDSGAAIAAVALIIAVASVAPPSTRRRMPTTTAEER